MKQQAGDLAKGKFENDRGSIVAGNANGGYAHKMFEEGVTKGAKAGSEYESTERQSGLSSPEGIAKFKHKSEAIQQTRKDAVDNTLAEISNATGLSDSTMSTLTNVGADVIFGAAANKWTGNPLGKGTKWLAKKSPFFKKKGEKVSEGEGNSQTFDSMKNDVTHSKTPSNKDSTSVPNKGEKSKFVSDGFGGTKPNPNLVEPSRFEKFAGIAKKAFSHIHSPKGSFTAMAVTAAAGYEMLSGTDAQAAEFPTQNVNPSAALSGAKKDMSLRKPPAQKSGTVLDNALEDASTDTGYAVLGLGILGLASKTAAHLAPVAGEVFSVFVQIRGSQKEPISKI